MTQHNLQVPEELIEAALADGFLAEGIGDEYAEVEARRFLQAILPKVRERLLESPKRSHGIEAAFDDAFPPEDSA